MVVVFKPIYRMIGALSLILLTPLTVLTLFLQTSYGRSFVIDQLAQQLKRETGYHLVVEESQSHFPFYLELQGVHLQAPHSDKELVYAQRIRCWWSPWQLLSHQLKIKQLKAEQVVVNEQHSLPFSIQGYGWLSLDDPLYYSVPEFTLSTSHYHFRGDFQGFSHSQFGNFSLVEHEHPQQSLAVGHLQWMGGGGFSIHSYVEALRWGDLQMQKVQLHTKGYSLAEALKGELSLEAESEGLELSLSSPFHYSSLEGISLPQIQGKLTDEQLLSGSLKFSPRDKRLDGELEASWEEERGKSIAHLQLGRLEDGAQTLLLKLLGPQSLVLDATYQNKEEAFVLSLNQLEGEFRGIDVKLSKAIEWRQKDDIFFLSPLSLSLGGGEIQAQLNGEAGSINGEFNLSNVPLGFIEAFHPDYRIEGSVSGQGSVSGSLTDPELALDLDIARCRQYKEGELDLPCLSGQLSAHLKDQSIATKAHLYDAGSESMNLELHLPFHLSFAPFYWELPTEEALTGQLRAKGALLPLVHVFVSDAMRLSGEAELAVDLGGSLVSPDIKGKAWVHRGVYESLHLGSSFHDIEMELDLEGQQLILTRLTATDGSKGIVKGKGQMRLSPQQLFPYSVEAQVNKAVLWEEDLITARGTGTLSIQGDKAGALLSGSLQVNDALIHIPEKLPVSIPSLDNVTYVNGPQIKKNTPFAQDKGYPLALDLSIVSKGPISVQGRGLNSEWKGELQVSGSTKKPLIQGPLKVQRGLFHFVGKDFRIQEGLIAFQGQQETVIDLKAHLDIPDYQVTAELQGPLKSPRLSLDASPTLEPSEILSRILFNKGIQHVSGVQAVTLANAAAELSGKESLNLLAKVSEGIGVDYIDIYQEELLGEKASDEEGKEKKNIAVKVGKQLSQSLFVSLSRGVHTGNTRFGVEALLGSGFSVEASVDDYHAGEFSLQWKKDY